MREEERGSPLQAPGITAPAIRRQRPVRSSIPRIATATAAHVMCRTAWRPSSPCGPVSQGTLPPPTTAQVAPAPRISAAPHRLEPWQPPQHHPPHLHCASRSCTAHPGCTCPICPHGAPSTIPAHYYAQCQITMLATGWDSMLLMRYLPEITTAYQILLSCPYAWPHALLVWLVRLVAFNNIAIKAPTLALASCADPARLELLQLSRAGCSRSHACWDGWTAPITRRHRCLS